MSRACRILADETKIAYKSATTDRFVDSAYGLKMRANWRDRTFRLCVDGTYGNFYADYLKSIDRTFIFLDIGANQGVYSILAAQNHQCACAFAFEPVKRTFELLVENVSANDLTDRIHPVRAAISSKFDFVSIKVPKMHTGRTSITRNLDARAHYVEEIRLMRAREFASILPPSHDIVVKIDTEGHEQIVLAELMECEFFSRVCSIFCEVDERWVERDEIVSQLSQHGLDNLVKNGSGKHYDLLASRAR